MKLANSKRGGGNCNKAFTLIELLAVIVILAIIALIAVPQILRILKQARLSAAEDTTYGVVEVTETYVGHLMLSNSGDLPVSEYEFECDGTGCYLTDSIKSQLSGYNYEENLNFKGTIPKSGTITVTQNGTIVTATDLQINEFVCQYNNEIASCQDGNGTSTPVTVSRIISYGVTANTSSINISIEAKDTETGFIKACHYLYDSSDNEITHECIEGLNNTNTYSNSNSYTFNGNVEPGHDYKVKTEMYITNTRILTSDIKPATTLAIGQPVITSSPSGWSQSKTVTINYNGNNNFEYYFYTSDTGTSNINVVSCGNNSSAPSTCDTTDVTNLSAGWYKTTGNVEITYNTEGEKHVIARTQDENGKFNFDSETISYIDTTAPTTPVFSAVANGDSIEVEITTASTDVSTVKYKYSKDNGSTWEPSDYTTSTTHTFSNLEDGDYNIVVKAVNETYENDGENNNNTTVTSATQVAVSTSAVSVNKGSDGILNKGDVVTIGTESFDVVYIDNNGTTNDTSDDKVVMLAQYNLNVGPNKISGTEGIQNSGAVGYKSGVSFTSNGGYPSALAFSVSPYNNYWNGSVSNYPAEVYDSRSNLYQYVTAYKTILEEYGATIEEARLLTYNEATTKLGCGGSTCPTSGENAFVTRTSFWLGAARSDKNVWFVTSLGNFNDYRYGKDDSFGVRPVIVMLEFDLS